MLKDGSLAQLFGDKVVVRGQTLAIPVGLDVEREVVGGGGVKIGVRPGAATFNGFGNGGGNGGGGNGGGGNGGGGGGANGGNGGGGNGGGGGGGGQDKKKKKGGGGLGGLFKGIGDLAGGAVSGLADAGKGALDFATGTGSAAAGDLAKTVGGAAGNVDDVVSSLNGIQKNLPLDALSGPAMDAFNDVQETGRNAANLLGSAGQVLDGFDGLTPDKQQAARENMREFAKKGGQLDQARKAFETFEKFPWDEEGLDEEIPASTGALSASGDAPNASALPSEVQPPATTPSAGNPSQERPRQESPHSEPEKPTEDVSTTELPRTEVVTEDASTTEARTEDLSTSQFPATELPKTQTPQSSMRVNSTVMASETQAIVTSSSGNATFALSGIPTTSAPQETEKSVTQTPQGTEISTTHATQETEQPTTTQSSGTATESSGPEETKVTHFLCTKDGTPLETFERLIKELDGGEGEAEIPNQEFVPHQCYLTKITPERAEAVRKLDFILAIDPWVFDIRELD